MSDSPPRPARRHILALALVGLLAGGAAVADPPTEAERAKARKLLDSANTHYNLGEWKAAITDYKECYRLVHNPVLLYNLGQAFRQDGDFESAVMFYRNYLRDEKNAPNKPEVERLIKDTEAASATKRASPAINPTARTANMDDAWTSTTNAPSNPTTPPSTGRGAPQINVRDIAVYLESEWKGAPAVKFDIEDVSINNYLGNTVHFGFNVRQSGKYLLWVGSAAEKVKFAQAIWPATSGVAKSYFYAHQFLREKGHASQPFEGCFYVVDTDGGAKLYEKCVPFSLPAVSAPVAPPSSVSASGAAHVTLKEIRVDTSSSLDGAPAVKFDVMDVSVANQLGNTVHFGFNIKDSRGKFLQWKPRKAEEVRFDPATWKGATPFSYPVSFLREHGAPGPLVGRFYVMETHTGRELFSKEVRFTLP